MLRIGKLTDYAMLILSQMAKEPYAVLSATSLADKLHLMPPTVSKVLKMLSEAQLVQSVRGAEGGYHLAREAVAITISDVITAMEGNVAMTECCESPGLCVIDTLCAVRENWLKINGLISDLLKGLTIADLLKPLSPTRVIEGLLHDK